MNVAAGMGCCTRAWMRGVVGACPALEGEQSGPKLRSGGQRGGLHRPPLTALTADGEHLTTISPRSGVDGPANSSGSYLLSMLSKHRGMIVNLNLVGRGELVALLATCARGGVPMGEAGWLITQ